MRTLEILLERRWILKSRERELYYQLRDELGTVKKFLTEKLGYQIIVNPYLVKVEKIPAKPESWMGIMEFGSKLEYVFFCMVLMFLEEKETEEQFVLSELTEFIEGQYREEQIDWTVYRYRRHLIKVMKYCVNSGILDVNDGSEEDFAKDDSSEVLYENTGVSRYFMKNFTQDIMGYTCPEDFEKEEWIDVNEERGIIRRQRVYRRLLMSMAMEKNEDTEEDFAYLRNYRNMIQGELSEVIDCELHVHRNSAFLVLGEDCRMGRCFPEEKTLSDVALLVNSIIQEKIREREIATGVEEQITVPAEYFTGILEECRERYGNGFSKTFRDMTTREFCHEVKEYMTEITLISGENEDIRNTDMRNGDVRIHTAVGKMIGRYPTDFLKDGGKDEQ